MDKPAINRQSRDWREIEAWAIRRINDARSRLESLHASESDTLVLRGRIAELRDLLKLGQQTPQPEETVDHDD